MSASTIFIRRSLDYRQSLIRFKEMCREQYKRLPPLLVVFLWGVSGLYTASRTGFSPNNTGVLLTFPVIDVLVMFASTLLLHKGLSGKHIYLTFPWIVLTICSIYFNHYQGLIDTITSFKIIKKVSILQWINLGINIFLMVLRVTVAIRVFQLSIHLWLKAKIQEMKTVRKK